MAIISIPSSIAGVSIPGALVKGPLGALFGNKFGLEVLQYPRDLASATRGHYIEFSVNKVTGSDYAEKISQTADAVASGEIVSLVKDTAEKITNSKEDIQQTLSGRTKNTETVIALYMPETMAFTYNTPYDDTSLLGIGQSIAGGLGGLMDKSKSGKAISGIKNLFGKTGSAISKAISIADTGGARLALQTQGLAINPQKQLLFQGIGFREYQLMFTFTPYSKQESETVEKIIKKFKENALPEITGSAGGMFFKIPSSFNLKFMFNGSENKKISKVTESVLTAIDVNYSPNTWSSYSDGAPVQIMLTLNFKEIQLVDSKKIKDGY